jgi:hypothetical protein
MPIIFLFAVGYLLVVGTQATRAKVSASYSARTQAWDQAHPDASKPTRWLHRAIGAVASVKYGTPLAFKAYRQAAKDGWSEGKRRSEELWKVEPRTENPVKEGKSAGKAHLVAVSDETAAKAADADSDTPSEPVGRHAAPEGAPARRLNAVPDMEQTQEVPKAPMKGTEEMKNPKINSEVSTPEQLLANLKATEVRAVAELEDAKSNLTRADQEMANAEMTAASMKNFKFSAIDVAQVTGLLDPAKANRSAAEVRLAAADGALAAAKRAVAMAAKHVQLAGQGAAGEFYQGNKGGTTRQPLTPAGAAR